MWGSDCHFTYPYEDSLALQIDVGDSEFVGERHCAKKLC